MIKYGYSQRTITPPLGIQMAGFLGQRKAEGVHDDLYAKALYLEFAEHQKFFLIALDTLAISLDSLKLLLHNLRAVQAFQRPYSHSCNPYSFRS